MNLLFGTSLWAMCSVSWEFCGSDRLSILFNRDESKDRSVGLPPMVFREGPLAYLCPIDSERGGTWLAASEKGLVVGILNDYGVPWDISRRAGSRGHLLRNLVQVPDLDVLGQRLVEKTATEVFPPFTLLAWLGKRVRMFRWDMLCLTPSQPELPFVTSSSWETPRVEKWRRDQYVEKVLQKGWDLNKFHRHPVPGSEASSVCMTRNEARTVSLTICRIEPDLVKMEYYARRANGEFEAGRTCELKP